MSYLHKIQIWHILIKSTRELSLMVIKISILTQNTNMTYFNYHAKAKRLIENGNCISASIFSNYHKIRPALVLYFENNIPIPIRDYMWKDYLKLLKQHEISINNPENINLNQFTCVDWINVHMFNGFFKGLLYCQFIKL